MQSVLSEKLKQSALKTVDYFQLQLQSDGSLGTHAQDLACYFKVPMMFVAANKIEHSHFILSYIQSAFMTENGDFKTKNDLKSAKAEYAEFWCYMNGWILRAAQKINNTEILNKGYNYFLSSIADNHKSFLTNHPELKNGITDILTIAHHGLIHLEKNDLKLARMAGKLLCDAIEQQQENLNLGFYLRLNAEKKIVTEFDSKDAPFYFIDKNKPQQLYFMIGYPCAFLALLFKATDEKSYLEYANVLFDFAMSCNDDILKSHFSHKIAWAASIFFNFTKNARYLKIIETISSYLLNNQAENGLWLTAQDINTAYDQSAEIACWFLEIARNLK